MINEANATLASRLARRASTRRLACSAGVSAPPRACSKRHTLSLGGSDTRLSLGADTPGRKLSAPRSRCRSHVHGARSPEPSHAPLCRLQPDETTRARPRNRAVRTRPRVHGRGTARFERDHACTAAEPRGSGPTSAAAGPSAGPRAPPAPPAASTRRNLSRSSTRACAEGRGIQGLKGCEIQWLKGSLPRSNGSRGKGKVGSVGEERGACGLYGAGGRGASDLYEGGRAGGGAHVHSKE